MQADLIAAANREFLVQIIAKLRSNYSDQTQPPLSPSYLSTPNGNRPTSLRLGLH